MSDKPPEQQQKVKITAINGACMALSTMKGGAGPKRRGNGRMRSAKLSMLTFLPLDVLFEIFGHLMPLDVLNLTRTSKDLRSILLHRSSSSCWKISLANVGLPECPHNMALPAWASLAFDTFCCECSKTRVYSKYWLLKTRLCRECANTILMCKSTLSKGEKAYKILLKCLPFDSAAGQKKVYYKISDKEEFIFRLNALPPDALNEFVKRTAAEIEAATEHANLSRKWSLSLIENRNKEVEGIKRKRRAAIEEKLIGLGYEKELVYLNNITNNSAQMSNIPSFHDHPFVKHNKPLTERAWENAQEEMIQLMEIGRRLRLDHEYRQVLSKRRQTLSSVWFQWRNQNCLAGDFIPGQVDIWLWKDAKEIVESSTDVEITTSSFYPLLERLPAFINEWRAAQMQEVYNRCNSHQEEVLSSTEFLQRATTVFVCSDLQDLHERCSVPGFNVPKCVACMWFPEFFYHACNSITFRFCDADICDIPDLCDYDCLQISHGWKDCRQKQWKPDSLDFTHYISDVVANLLKCSELPNDTTVQTLDAMDFRVVCLKCSHGRKIDGERVFSVMTWRNAVQHCLKDHYNSQVEWQRISLTDVATAKDHEMKEQTKRAVITTIDRIWRCKHCQGLKEDPGVLGSVDMKEHLLNAHHIKDPKNAGRRADMFKAGDTPPVQPFTVQMVPKNAFIWPW